MILPTVVSGIILVALGIYSYATGTPREDTGTVSPTALIPAFFGLALLLCAGLVLWQEKLRKHVMHGAALIALLGLLGGFMPIIRSYSKTGTVNFNSSSVQSGLAMTGVCFVFIVLCIQSFRAARKARENQNASSAS